MNPTDTLDANIVIYELRTMITELLNSKQKYEHTNPYMSASYAAVANMLLEFANKIGIGDEVNQ